MDFIYIFNTERRGKLHLFISKNVPFKFGNCVICCLKTSLFYKDISFQSNRDVFLVLHLNVSSGINIKEATEIILRNELKSKAEPCDVIVTSTYKIGS